MAADLEVTRPGRWAFACAVHDHIEGGMQAMLRVAATAEELAAVAVSSAADKAAALGPAVWATLAAAGVATLALLA